MDRQTIINQLVKDEQYKTICRKIAPDYADDLYQELVLAVLEMPEEKLKELHATCLSCFFYRMAQWQFYSHHSKFYRTFLRDNKVLKTKTKSIIQAMEPSFDHELMQKVDKVMGVMATKDWYDVKVMELYAEMGSVQKVSDATDIPARSLRNTVTRTRSLIKKKVNKL